MKLKEIYQFCVEQGIREDLRGRKKVAKKLFSIKKEYRKIKGLQKKFFDKEDFLNPYADTRILNGQNDIEIKKILVGIDIGVSEILLADRMRSRGKKIDLIISHHPLGMALAGLYDVMDIHTELLSSMGIDKNIASLFMKERIEQVERSVHSANHLRVVDAAKQCDIPLMCCHTPADNHVAGYLQKVMDSKRPKILKNVIDLLLKEKEYRIASQHKAGPKILLGRPEDKAGKIILDMTGGTEGSGDVFARISQVGVKTLVGMHMSDKHFTKVKKEQVNVVIAGHIASDNLGLNLLFDKLEKKSKNFEFSECSGFRRVKR